MGCMQYVEYCSMSQMLGGSSTKMLQTCPKAFLLFQTYIKFSQAQCKFAFVVINLL